MKQGFLLVILPRKSEHFPVPGMTGKRLILTRPSVVRTADGERSEVFFFLCGEEFWQGSGHFDMHGLAFGRRAKRTEDGCGEQQRPERKSFHTY